MKNTAPKKITAKGSARPAKGKALPEEDRSSVILAAAFEVFARSGYAAARMEEIAEKAGVTKGLIYFYYDNKEALFKAVIRNHLIENVHTKMDMMEINPSRSMASHLMQALALVSYTLDERNNSLVPGMMRLLLTEGQRFQDLHKFHYQEVLTPLFERFRHILEEGARRGEWKAERIPAFIQIVIAPIVVRLIWNIVFGASQHLDAGEYLRATQVSLLYMLGVDPASVALESSLPVQAEVRDSGKAGVGAVGSDANADVLLSAPERAVAKTRKPMMVRRKRRVGA